MSRSLLLHTAARGGRVTGRASGLARDGGAEPRRVRERPPTHPGVAELLEGASELGSVPAESLPAVVRALEEAGHVVVVRYDADQGRLAYYARPARAPLARDPAPEADPRPGSDPAVPRFEGEGSERRSVGSVAVEAGAWWSAALSLPEGEGATLYLQLQRHGAPPAGYRGDTGAELSLPAPEADAVVALLAGILAQARRDGVLTAR